MIMANLGKVTIDKAGVNKKAQFDFSHDCNTSFQFGEIQPVLFHRCQTGQETHTFDFTSVIRMTDLAVATFGRSSLRYSCHFVSYDDIFPNWDKVLSAVPDSYFDGKSPFGEIPLHFPRIGLNTLLCFLMTKPFANIEVYTHQKSVQTSEYIFFDQEQYSFDIIRYVFQGTDPNSNLFSASDFRSYYYLTGRHLTPSASDFVFRTDNGSSTDFLVCVKLNSRGRRLYKVLTGLEYTLDPQDPTFVDFGALLAYYYAYFMAYSLPRYDNWLDTNAYKLIKFSSTFTDFDIHLTALLNQIPSDIVPILKDFFYDLSECWYSENSDFVSCSYSPDANNPSVDDQNLGNLLYVRAGNNANAGNMFDQLSSGSDQPSTNGLVVSTMIGLDQVTDEILKKLYISINKDSAIGFDIKKRLLAKGFKSFVDEAETHFIFSRSIPIKISDVNANSDTYNPEDGTGKPLGSYTGKGVSADSLGKVTYTNSQPGYFICLATVVPDSKVVNALNPAHLALNRYTHYNPDYDSVGFEQVSKQLVGKFRNVWYTDKGEQNNNHLFGLQPRYTGFKTATCNVLNGLFSLRSEREQWLPYTLDKVIVENSSAGEYNFNPETGRLYWTDADDSQIIPVAGKTWRFPTDKSWKGNFDRIFLMTSSPDIYWDNDQLVDVDPVSDHFICDIAIDHTAYAYMLPSDESWQTIDKDDSQQQMTTKN